MLYSSFFAFLATVSAVAASAINQRDPDYYPPPHTTCSTKFYITSTVETTKTVTESIKTVYVPVTTTGYVTKTKTVDVPHTSVGHTTSYYTKTKTEHYTKTVPVTTYTTSVGTKYETYVDTVTKPHTTIKTDHSTVVTKVPTTGVTTTKTTSHYPVTTYVSHTKPLTKSKVECTTKYYKE